MYCLAPDGRTAISPRMRIEKETTLLSLLRTAGADDETLIEVRREIQRSGRGTVAMFVNDRGRELLSIGAV